MVRFSSVHWDKVVLSAINVQSKKPLQSTIAPKIPAIIPAAIPSALIPIPAELAATVADADIVVTVPVNALVAVELVRTDETLAVDVTAKLEVVTDGRAESVLVKVVESVVVVLSVNVSVVDVDVESEVVSVGKPESVEDVVRGSSCGRAEAENAKRSRVIKTVKMVDFIMAQEKEGVGCWSRKKG